MQREAEEAGALSDEQRATLDHVQKRALALVAQGEPVRATLTLLTAAVESKRLQMVVKPAWEPATKKSITDMMERAVKAGFYPSMPDAKIIYAP